MRPLASIGDLAHSDLVTTPDDHHAQPIRLSVSNTSQSISAGADYNLDLDLGNSGFTFARAMLMGPATSGGALWRECASIHITADASDALGHSFRATGSSYLSYSATYAKTLGVTNLSHKIFDSNAAANSRYIALKDAQIIGSTLRLTFHNYHSSSATLWVKGEVLVW